MADTKRKAQVIEMLETVIDPELGVDIYTMGLIYDVVIISDTEIRIVMTFTTPLCPAGEMIKAEVVDSLRILGYTEIDVEVTFDPPWRPSAELREALGV